MSFFEEAGKKLLDFAPQLGIAVLFMVGLFFLLREYRQFQGEMTSTIEGCVKAQLGTVVGDIQIKSTQASGILKQISETLNLINGKSEETKSQSQKFERWLSEEQSKISGSMNKITGSMNELENRLSIIGEKVGVAEVKITAARNLVALARQTTSVGEALNMIAEAEKDTDATSTEMEVAADVARQQLLRRALARKLYKKAIELDPENKSATIELLALEAVMDPKRREDALREARLIVINTLSARFVARLIDAYFDLGRLKDAQSLCEEILKRQIPSSSPIVAMAHRNLAVALKEQYDTEAANSHFERALSISPNDENVLKGYLSFLNDQNDYEKALFVAKKLILIDPLDGSYFLALGKIYSELGNHREAINWFSGAEELFPQDTPEWYSASKEKEKALRRIRLLFDTKEAEEHTEESGPRATTRTPLDPLIQRADV